MTTQQGQGGGLPENVEARRPSDFGPGGSAGPEAGDTMRQNPRRGKRNMPRVDAPPKPSKPRKRA
jgi:hypothetical protein